MWAATRLERPLWLQACFILLALMISQRLPLTSSTSSSWQQGQRYSAANPYSGMARYQRGDQGPDETDINGKGRGDLGYRRRPTTVKPQLTQQQQPQQQPASTSTTSLQVTGVGVDVAITGSAVVLRGPNVCRASGQSHCCPGWSQRGNTGLCLVPICKLDCGRGGRCIKPGLCICSTGSILPRCGSGKGCRTSFRLHNKL